MALKVRNKVKTMTALAARTLKADADESFRIKAIYCKPEATDTYVQAIVQGVTVGKFRAVGCAGNHIPFPFVKTTQIYEALTGGLFERLLAAGFDLSIPIASGETLTISQVPATGLVSLLYDVYDDVDVKPDEPNGTMARIRRYLHYMTNAAAIEADLYKITKSLIWTGGDEFPVNSAAVPQNNVFRIFGILGAPASASTGGVNKGYTTHLQIIRRNEVLFDEDRSGLPFRGEATYVADDVSYVSEGSVIGPMTAENPAPALIFPEPIELAEGDKLTVNLVLSGAGSGGITTDEIDLALLMEHEYLT